MLRRKCLKHRTLLKNSTTDALIVISIENATGQIFLIVNLMVGLFIDN